MKLILGWSRDGLSVLNRFSRSVLLFPNAIIKGHGRMVAVIICAVVLPVATLANQSAIAWFQHPFCADNGSDLDTKFGPVSRCTGNEIIIFDPSVYGQTFVGFGVWSELRRDLYIRELQRAPGFQIDRAELSPVRMVKDRKIEIFGKISTMRQHFYIVDDVPSDASSSINHYTPEPQTSAKFLFVFLYAFERNEGPLNREQALPCNIGPIHGSLSRFSGDFDCLFGRISRTLGISGSGARMEQGAPKQQNAHEGEKHANPSRSIHPDSGFSHTLLGGEITFLNAFKFAIGIVVAGLGFYVAGCGADRTVADGLSWRWRLIGWGWLIVGTGLAVMGAGIATFDNGAWRSILGV